VRRLAAVALALLGSQAGSAGPALAKALGDESFASAASPPRRCALVEPEPKDVLDALVKTLRTDRDADVCQAAAIAAASWASRPFRH